MIFIALSGLLPRYAFLHEAEGSLGPLYLHAGKNGTRHRWVGWGRGGAVWCDECVTASSCSSSAPGLSLIRGMYYDYPEESEAYTYQDSQVGHAP